jgi:hypothetical protein
MSDNGTESRWVDGEPPPSEEERGQARDFGDRLDRLLRGEPVASEDDLLAAARMTRGALDAEERLTGERREAILDQAIRQARTQPERRRSRIAAPVLALAAGLLLVISVSLLFAPVRESRAPLPRPLPQLLSRPSNDLLGRPFQDRSGASSRLDLVYADRLNGYRQVTLGMRESR